MKAMVKIIPILLLFTALSACATVALPVSATTNPVGSKVGESGGNIWFGILGNADASMRTAANNAGITEISTVDIEVFRVFGLLFSRYTVTVTGE